MLGRRVQRVTKDSVCRHIWNASANVIFPSASNMPLLTLYADTLNASLKDPNAVAKVCFQDTLSHTFNDATNFSQRLFAPLKNTFADALTFASDRSVCYFCQRTFAGAFCRRENALAKVKWPLPTLFVYFSRRVDAPQNVFIFVLKYDYKYLFSVRLFVNLSTKTSCN